VSKTKVQLLTVVVLFLLTELLQGVLIMCCIFKRRFFENVYIPLVDSMDIIALIYSSIVLQMGDVPVHQQPNGDWPLNKDLLDDNRLMLLVQCNVCIKFTFYVEMLYQHIAKLCNVYSINIFVFGFGKRVIVLVSAYCK